MKVRSKIRLFLFLIFGPLQVNAQLGVVTNHNDNSLGHEIIDEVSVSASSDFHFTENKGQFKSSVKYHCKLHIGDIFFKNSQFSFNLFSAEELNKAHDLRHNNLEDSSNSFVFNKHIYNMNFLGANEHNLILPTEELLFKKNYFRGNDTNFWSSDVSSYSFITYKNLYDGIDVNIYSEDNHLKYDYVVSNYSNPKDIVVEYEGVSDLRLIDGKLEVILSNSVVRELTPFSYQTINGKKVEVVCEFILNGNAISFDFPNGYDSSKTLIIDPILVFATLTGSSSDNWGFTATYDDSGNFYSGSIVLNGGWFGTSYPTTLGAYQTSFAGGDADVAISKFSSDGTTLIYSTYLGGNKIEEPHSLICDDQNNLIIMGATSSANFPTTSGAYQGSFGGGNYISSLDGLDWDNGSDIFITKLNAAGNSLIGSTFIGGSSNDGLALSANLNHNYADHARGEVMLDDNDNIYIASSTKSSNFPTTPSSHSQSFSGNIDGVVCKLSPNLNNLLWSTYLGGSSADAAYSVRVDTVNNQTVICGGTTSNNIGATSGTINAIRPGGIDGYVATFSNLTGSLNALTYLGTSSYDQSFIVELDNQNNIYVVGQTNGNYPVTSGVYSNTGANQFIHKMNSSLTTTNFSTVFGSINSSNINISLTAFLVDNCDNIYVSGWGGSTNNQGNTNNMPITPNAIQSITDGNDFYFITLEAGAQSLIYGSYFGGTGGSSGEHVDGGTSRFNKEGIIYQAVCAGCSGGSFPTTPSVYGPTNGSSNCNYGGIKIDFEAENADINVYGVSFNLDTLVIPCNTTIDLEAQVNGSSSITWNTGSVNNIINVGAGQYYFTLSSTGACVLDSDTITIVEQTLFSTSFTLANVSCNGYLDGNINISVSGGLLPYTYSWVNTTSGFTYNTEDLSNIAYGDYWCTVTDANGCSALPFQVIITEPDAISINSISTDINCFGDSSGGISLNAAGGNPPLSFIWTGPNGFTANTDPLFSLQAGTYSAIISDFNNCPPVTDQLTLIEPLIISAAYLSSNISCFGQNDGAIDLTLSGGTSPYYVTWQGPNGFFSISEDINNLSPGFYTLNVIDNNSCLLSSSIQVLIVEPAEISYSYTQTNISCYGEQNGAIDLNVNGGIGFLTIIWTYPDGSQNILEDINGIGSGNYSFTISDVNSCNTTSIPPPIFITEPNQIQIAANIQNELCYGDSDGLIDITVSNAIGPFNYSWNGPQLFSSSMEDIVGLSSGSYQLIVTDNSNLCTEQSSFIVSAGMQLQVISSLSNVSCKGYIDGSINLSTNLLSNPVYAWSNGQITEDVFNLSAGNYSVLLTDDSNCPSYLSFLISEPISLQMSANVMEVSCVGGNNGEISINVTGGTPPYNYIWSNGNLSSVNQLLNEGNYVLNVSDLNNCILQDSFLLLAEDFNVKAVISDPKCFGGTDGLVDIEIIGGDYPFVYNWSSGQTSQDVINIGAGGYFLNITDAFNCIIDTLIFVNEPPVINATTNTIDASCFGTNTGSVSIQVVGGNPPYVIDWGSVDTGAMYSGIFPFQITDATACIYANTVTILQNDSIGISFVKSDVKCYGESTGAIDIQILLGSGTPPYAYEWSGPNLFSSSSEDINNLIAGIYTLLVTDANSCIKQVQVVVDEPTPLNQIVNITTSDYTGYHIACKGDNSGWVNIDVDGGYIPFSYAWNTGSVSDSIFGLYVGNYQVTIIDGIGCRIEYALTLQEPSSEMVGNISSIRDYNSFDITCYGNSDGAIEEVVTGGAGIYTYQWNNGMNSSSIFNLPAGYYEVIVYDNNGCLWMDSITLYQPDSLSLILQISSDTCERGVGYAEVFLNGGVPLYNLIWSSGQFSAVINDFSEGTYEVVASDENQCIVSSIAVIENLSSPDIDFLRLPNQKRFYEQKDKPFVFVDMTETFWQNVVSWEWDFGDNTFSSDSIVSHSYNESGEYRVHLTIETEYNCIDTISKKVLVDEYEIFIPNAFTPGTDDKLNNEFKPFGYGIKKFTMKIYDRWGSEIFETNSIDVGWDGRKEVDGDFLQTGIYLYFIKVENIYGGVIIYQDGFKLIR